MGDLARCKSGYEADVSVRDNARRGCPLSEIIGRRRGVSRSFREVQLFLIMDTLEGHYPAYTVVTYEMNKY